MALNIHYIQERTNSTIVQLFRYFWVGGLAFIVDYGLLWLLTELAGIPYLSSAAISFTMGLVVNYVLSTIWVFSQHRSKNKWTEFIVFSIIGILGLGLNEIIMYTGSDILKIHYMLTKIVSTGIVFFWNFLARKYILFTE